MDVEQFALDLAADPDEYWCRSADHGTRFLPLPCDLATTEEIMERAKHFNYATESTTNTALGNALHKAHPIRRLEQVRTPLHGRKRLWTLRNHEKWGNATPAAIAEHYDQHHPWKTATEPLVTGSEQTRDPQDERPNAGGKRARRLSQVRPVTRRNSRPNL